MAKTVKLTDKQKAAALLVSLGMDVSANVMKEMREEDIEQLTLEIANMRKLPSEIIDEVVKEFYELCVAKDYVSQGGIEYAEEVLQKALGANKATEIINRLSSSLEIAPFDFLRHTDPNEVFNFIENEHPQTQALVVAHLTPEQSAVIFSKLAPEVRVSVIKRIALMDRTTPEIISDVERVLEKKVAAIAKGQEYSSAGGVESVVNILNRVDRGTEKNILESLEEEDQELTDEIRRKLFTFEDVVTLDDRAVQRFLREVDSKKLALALKTVNDDLKDKIFKNMSQRAGEMLREELEYLGPVRLRDVEEAQQEIINVVRRLEEEGEIIIARGGEEEIIV
ncbi:MAG TPA: flagellar motor switch protein FliG [Thermoplasmata archaeon]|nr:flagellar motor switch protein FliG [Thermoplasmata archaeon]